MAMSADHPLTAPSREPSPAGFARVVCGVDGSAESHRCVRQAIDLANSDADLYAVGVVDPGLAAHAGIHAAEVLRDLRREAIAALQRAEEEAPGIETQLLNGREGSSLLAMAEAAGADLIAVGSHGSGRALGTALGSVATAIAHRSSCSVLVARDPAGHDFPGTILLATDGSASAAEAARIAGGLAARHDSVLALLSVGDDPERADEIAAESVALIEATGRAPVVITKQGSSRQRIVETAEEIEASLVIVGSRSLSGLRRLGSVSEHVVHQAHCSVLVVRETRPASSR
jgi:nucleotide-binding universal stress UspA family protein